MFRNAKFQLDSARRAGRTGDVEELESSSLPIQTIPFKPSRRQAAKALCALVLGAGTAAAQPRSREIHGRVTDQRGILLNEAVVHLENSNTLQIRSFRVQSRGFYRFRNLRPEGEYEVWASSRGESSSRRKLDRFSHGKDIEVNLAVKLRPERS